MKRDKWVTMKFFVCFCAIFFACKSVSAQETLEDRTRESKTHQEVENLLPADHYATGDRTFSLIHDGLTRTYQVHIPQAYDGRTAVALLLVLHGNKGTGESMRELTLNGFNRLSDTDNFIVVYPDGMYKSWNDGRDVTPAGRKHIDDVGFIRALLEKFKKYLNIDADRIYVAGMSNGAMFSHRLGCELSDIIAAIAAVAGTMPEVISTDCDPTPLPVIMFHGTEDAYAPYEGGQTRRGGRGFVLSAQDTARFWAEKNDCDPAPVAKKLPDTVGDGTRIIRRSYDVCSGGADVVLYQIINGGHTWPGGWQYLPKILVGKTTKEIDANEIIWEFFKQHPRQ